MDLFTLLRYQNYASARYLAFTCGSFQTIAHYVMSLAIELTYKQLCKEMEVRGIKFTNAEDKIIRREHNLLKLHKLCVDKGLLKDIIQYEKFIEYADILYKTRYPSHYKEAYENLSSKIKVLSFSVYNIYPFDDLMLKLDKEVYRYTGDVKKTILFWALDHTNTHFSNSFFHCNAQFYDEIDEYSKYLNPARPQNYDTIELLKNSKDKLWLSKEVYMQATYESAKKYDMKYIEENGFNF